MACGCVALVSITPGAAAATTLRIDAPQLTRGAFSPNGDGVGDAVELGFALSLAAEGDVTVVDGSGTPVRSLWTGALPAGQSEFAWDGFTDAGTRAPDGPYAVVVSATVPGHAPAGVRLPVVVDTVRPRALRGTTVIRHRDDVRKLRVPVRVSEPVHVRLQIFDGEARYALSSVRTPGSQRLRVRTADRWYMRRVQGRYRLYLTAVDAAGNRRTSSVPVRVVPRPRPRKEPPPEQLGGRYLPAWLRPVMYRATEGAGVPRSWANSKALALLIRSESSFNPRAQNPTSTAYGLFQFLDQTWATVGGRKTSDPYLQSVYGLRYIKRRYGTPERAWSFWLSQSPHWY